MNILGRFWVVLLLSGIVIPAGVAAAELSETYYTAVYFHGIGCSHCAKVDDPLFSDWVSNSTHLVVIDYEVMQDRANGPVLLQYNAAYKTGTGVPILFFSPSRFMVGDTKILSNTSELLTGFETNPSLRNQYAVPFRSIAVETLPGHPRLWYQDRVLIRTDSSDASPTAGQLLLTRSIPPALTTVSYEKIDPITISFARMNRTFEHAVAIPGWILQWNADELPKPVAGAPSLGQSAETTTPQQSPLAVGPLAVILGIGIYGYIRRKAR